VVPISDQLRLILKDARQRTDTYVVEYRGRPVKTIRGGLRSAVERAGLPFGRAVDGATFHTLRHTAASLLAELGEPEAIRKEVMGHRNIATTQRYTKNDGTFFESIFTYGDWPSHQHESLGIFGPSRSL